MADRRFLSLLSLLLMLSFCAGVSAQTPTPAASTPALTETQTLQAENIKLRAALVEAQKRIAELEVRDQQAKITQDVADFVRRARATLGAKPTDTFDWNTLTFKAAESKQTEP